MTPTTQGAIVLVVTLAMLLSGAPVAFGLGAISILFVVLFQGFDALHVVAETFYSGLNDFTLVSIPMFVMMGAAIGSSPAGKDLYEALDRWLYRVPGGLVISNLGACALFAALTGSSPACCAAIGKMGIPEMRRRGYPDDVATGSICAGGTLGILIPPSISMVVYGVVTDTSVGHLFIAGIVPGIMLATLMSMTVLVWVWFCPEWAPPVKEEPTRREKWLALGAVTPVIVLTALVIGSIFSGAATPTEAGAVGAFGALFIALFMRRLTMEVLWVSLQKTIRTTAMFLLLLTGGTFSSYLMARLGIPQAVSDFMTGLPLPPWAVMVIINFTLLILGTFMDAGSMVVIVIPIFLKTILSLGYDPVWFGIVVVIQSEIAAISPPVGFNLFVLKSVVPGVSDNDVANGAMIFVFPMLAAIAILTVFPDIALFLPRMLLTNK